MQVVLCTLQIEDFMQGNHVAHEFILACCMINVKTVLKSLIIQLFFCSINLSTEVDICRKLNAFLRLDKLCEYKVLFSLVILLLIY